MPRVSCSTTATCSGSTSFQAGIASRAAVASITASQTTTQFNQGGYVNILFGQSYQLFGINSFAAGDATNTGLNSGLDTRRSDYVARLAYQPDRIFTFTTRYRFDEQNFDMRRFELEGRANFDRMSLQALYGNYDKQPELGFLTRREGILGGVSYKVTQNWAVAGGSPLRPRRQQVRPDPAWTGIYRRLPYLGPELHHELHIQRQSDEGP